MRDLGARTGASSSHLVRRGGDKSRRLRGFLAAQSCPAWPGERCRRRRHGWRDHPLLGRRAASQCRRHGQGEVGAGPRLSARAAQEGGRPVVSFLAISGGGADGAFGAGVLAGWTQRGNRPEFDLVTGVSTGALDRAVRLPRTALRRCAEEGLHRVNHKRHCHRAARQRTARRGVACEQRAARQSGRLLRQRANFSKRWPPNT